MGAADREAAEEAAAREAEAERERLKAAAFLTEELKRKEEAEALRLEAEAKERAEFAVMRKDLEAEWLQRLEAQKKELAAKQESLVKERQAVLSKHLHDDEFKGKVEEALQRRLSEPRSAPTTAAPLPPASAGPVVELTCPAEAEMGSKITVFWEYKSGKPSLSDWIGYYKKSRDEHSNQYYTYHKTGGSEKGKLEFTVPNKLGICEMRMFQNNNYNPIARSGAIRVGNRVSLAVDVKAGEPLTVTCSYSDRSKQHSSWDWVAIFEETQQSNRVYLCSAYVTKDAVKLPLKKPGRYVARYFQSGSGYSDLAESPVFEIPDRDWIKVITPERDIRRNASVQVQWNIESIDPSSKDRVGLFRAGEFNPLLPLSIQLTHCNKASGTLNFQLSPGLAPGMFEFVFMARNSSKPVKRSVPFEIKK